MPGMENCDICANDVFRSSWKDTGVERKAFDAPPPARPKPAMNGHDQEELIRTITERVMAALAAK